MSNSWNLVKNGSYLEHDGKFVARFRSYHKGRFSPAKFIKALKAQHTPATYFEAMASGKAPLEIVTL